MIAIFLNDYAKGTLKMDSKSMNLGQITMTDIVHLIDDLQTS
jgi:hypothetical protein